jgi:DNA-binding SARP family transcriptional activator
VFGVLGQVALWRHGRELHIGTAKHRQLLVVLLLHANERVARSTIIELIWGRAPVRSADNLVQKYIGDLRRSFDPERTLLCSVPGGYRLRVDPVQLDSGEFAARIDRARAARTQGELAGAEQELRDALALWRGPVLDGVELDLVEAERARLEDLRIGAREDLVDLMLARGERDSVLAELSRLVGAYPLRERSRELQMLALYRQGRQAEALSVFADVQRLLADELGVDPGFGLRRLHERILRSDPALDPEPGEPGEAAPLPPRWTVCQLPPDIADFTGRTDVLDDLVTTLSAGSADTPPTMVTITGAPGVGKSCVAVRAAHAVRARFPDGQLHVDLAGMSDEPRDPAEILVEWLRVFGVTGAATPSSLHELTALYRSLMAGRRMLVVLDDAIGADQVRPLLPATGGCAVIVTARGQLRELAGARQLTLDTLAPQEARALFTSIVGAARVAGEPESATAILDACGNLPLAIRVAATKLAGRPGWTLRVLRDRLADESRRLGELRTGDLGVRAGLDMSRRLLPEAAATALGLFGLLGAQTLPGWVVGALLDRPDADDVLDTLVDASLLQLVGTDRAGQPRYRLHDLVRAYCVEVAGLIPAALRSAALIRVLAGWLSLAEAAVDRMPPSLFQPPKGSSPRWALPRAMTARLVGDPVRWFDVERDTVAAAVKLAVANDLDELAWELAAITVPYYDHGSHYPEWQRGHNLALRAVRASGNALGQAVLLWGIGQVCTYRDRNDAAAAAFNQSAQLAQEIGHKQVEAMAVAGLGTIARARDRYADAVAYVRYALGIVAAEELTHLEAQLRNAVGVCLLRLDRMPEARDAFAQALELAHRSNDAHREAVVLRGLSDLHRRVGDRDEALRCLDRAMRIFGRLDDRRCGALAELATAQLHAELGYATLAVPALHHARRIFHSHGDYRVEAECWQLLGQLAAEGGDLDLARRQLANSLHLWARLGDGRQVAETHARLDQLLQRSS